MKKLYKILLALLISGASTAQTESVGIKDDTTKIKIGNMTIIFGEDGDEDSEFDFNMDDTTDVDDEKTGKKVGEMQIIVNI